MTDSERAPGTGDEPRPQRAGHHGRHRTGGRGFPGWLLPATAALGLGLLVGVTVTEHSLEASAVRTPLPVAAQEPASADDPPGAEDSAAGAPQAVVPSLPSAPSQQPVSHAPSALTHVEPVQLDIPSIDLSSPLVGLGLNVDKTLEVPVDFSKPGWFTQGSYPGDPQGPPAIIAGHVDDYTGPAVFARLGELQEGAEIVLLRADSSVAVFRVTTAQRFAKDAFPAQQVYAAVPTSELVLITCTGGFDEQARSYLDNLVVRAELDLDRSLELTSNRSAVGVGAPDSDLPNV